MCLSLERIYTTSSVDLFETGNYKRTIEKLHPCNFSICHEKQRELINSYNLFRYIA